MGSSVDSVAVELLITDDESLVQPDKKAIAINEKIKYFILIRFPPFYNKSLFPN